MKRSSGHLLRFIDLGLLLLLAFLSVAELNPTLQVPLPGKPGGLQEAAVARVKFNQDWEMAIMRLNPSQMLCRGKGTAELAACMNRHAPMRFLLVPYLNTPAEAATVQQVVTLLDICKRTAHLCEIEPLQP